MCNVRAVKLMLLVCLFLLTGCTAFLRSNVVTFHEGPLPAGETIRIVAIDPAKQSSLEFRNYANLISEELRKIGYTPSTDANAQLLAEVDYSVDPGPTRVTFDRPQRFVRYHFNFGRYYDPFYFGVYNSWDPEIYSTTPSYQRNLQLNIVHNDEEQTRIFEGRVQSVGRQNLLPQIMPYLITAMFANYPGENGVPKVVTIEMDE